MQNMVRNAKHFDKIQTAIIISHDNTRLSIIAVCFYRVGFLTWSRWCQTERLGKQTGMTFKRWCFLEQLQT